MCLPNVGADGSVISDAETNIEKVLKEAKKRAGKKAIEIKVLREVISSLCPIFPFC